jgi:hypothetical protein
MVRESPRIRRLRSDLRAIERLKDESSILDFSTNRPAGGGPPDYYVFRFDGRGFFRPEGSREVQMRDFHEMTIQLGAAYPRMMPELAWRTPIFHPNISASGVVCLGGYGTHWVPSVNLDELCHMLWDMIRYQNFDVESPYNREAAAWAKTQTRFRLPIDARSLRDKVASGAMAPRVIELNPRDPEVSFVEVVDAEIVTNAPASRQPAPRQADPDILFIE